MTSGGACSGEGRGARFGRSGRGGLLGVAAAGDAKLQF